MHGRRSSDTSLNELLMEGHAESPTGFVVNPKSIIIKAGNQFNSCVSNFNHDQKYKTWITFGFILKESYFIFEAMLTVSWKSIACKKGE